MEKILQVGDKVRIIKQHKYVDQFDSEGKKIESLIKIHNQGLSVINREGLIEKVRLDPGCEYEEQTKDQAIYLVKFLGGGMSWDGKHLHFFPDELQSLGHGSPTELKTLAPKEIDEAKELKRRLKDKYQK